MKIIKSKSFGPQKCEYGDFELKPEKGWKLSQTFIDYESKLLVVSILCEDESTWTDNGFIGRSIPTKEFKIDLKTLKVLKFEEWKQYFNYEKTEFISDDRKYRLVTQRMFEPNRYSDGIKEELYEISTNTLISLKESIAFMPNKRENLLESLYRSIREKEEQKRILDAEPTLEKFYFNQLNKLQDNDVVIGYMDDSNTYKLVFFSNRFILYRSDKVPSEDGQWKTMQFSEINTYSSLEDFWEDLTTNARWFSEFRIHQSISEQRLVLAKHITHYFNSLRKEHKFTYAQYDRINEWQNSIWSDEYKETEFRQWCANCYREVYYQARYPKYICSNCASKETVDSEGNLLVFSNLGLSGGFKIIRMKKDGQIIEEDNTKQFCDCIIEGKSFFAQEAKFGGVVIQQKE